MRGYYILIVFFLLGIIYSTPNAVAAPYDFETWSARGGVFTIGRPSPFMIYVHNTGSSSDSYTISEPQVDYMFQGVDLSHLIHVNLASNTIENLGAEKIGDTQGAIILLGQVFQPGATITFTVTSDSGMQKTSSIDISSGNSSGLPVTLPEFTLFGMMQMFFLAGLVVFYSSHIR